MLRHTLPALLLLACAPPEGASPGEPEVSSFLAHAPDDFAERTVPLPGARASLHLGGEPLPGEPWASLGQQAFTVVDAHEDRDALAVLWEGAGVRLVLWLPRHDLQLNPVQAAWIGGDTTGVRLPAGTPLEPVASRPGWVKVGASNGRLTVEAWTPSARVDHWYYDGDRWASIDPMPTDEPVRLAAGVTFLDQPDGEPIASAHADEALRGWVVDADGPWRRVQLRADAWAVDAWVHAEDTEPSGLFGTGWGTASYGIGCGGWGALAPNVRGDAALRDAPFGAEVARTTRPVSLRLGPEDADGWRPAAVRTPFGTARLWVAPDDGIDQRAR